MPTYQYRCTSCAHEWEEQRTVDDRDYDLTCPTCSTKTITRVYTPTPAVFKGSGFHSTDYRRS